MEIANLEAMKAYMALDNKKAGHSELGLRKKEAYMTPRASSIPKIKLVQGSSALYLFPLELRLPFDPRNLESEMFDSENPFILPFSVSDSIALLKEMAKESPELHQRLADLAKVSVEEYDLNDTGESTANDKAALHRYRNAVVYHTTVQEFNMSGFGKYGRKGLSLAKFDEYGVATEKDLGYQMYEFEVALANSRIAQIEAEYGPGGIKADKPATEMAAEKKLVWQGLKVKTPKPAGVMRVLHIPCAPNWSIKLEDNKDSADVLDNMKDYEGYIGGSYDAVKEVESMLGTGYDVHENYLEVAIHYPIGKGKTDGEKALNSYSNREFTKNPLTRVKNVIPGFEEAYNAFRSDSEVFSEESILKSVFQFRPIADETLIEHYKADLGKQIHLINAGTAEKFAELIERIDSSLSEQVMLNVMSGIAHDGEANTAVPQGEDGAKEYIVGDHSEDVETEETPVEDLLSGTDLK